MLMTDEHKKAWDESQLKTLKDIDLAFREDHFIRMELKVEAIKWVKMLQTRILLFLRSF